jgi:hypothetical protein
MASDAKLQLGDYLLPLVRGVAPPGRVVLPGGWTGSNVGRIRCPMENARGGRDGPPERGTTQYIGGFGSETALVWSIATC